METVAVIFGGRSAEHDVSIVTAIASVIKPLELSRKYRVEAVYIAKNGAWYWDDRLKDIKLYSSKSLQAHLDRIKPAGVRFDGGMTLVKSKGLAGRKTMRKIDIVFPAMHGTYGEDGALMGLLDMAGVAYVGCGVAAAAVAMDKLLCKELMVANDIPTPKFLSFSKSELEHEPAAAVRAVLKNLKYPLFIKPVHLGSSIAISRVTRDADLKNALEVAAHYDDRVLIEEAVQNLVEVTLPIIGNNQPRPAYLEQPMTKPEDFFDFDTKYMQGGKKGKGGVKGSQGYSQIPASLSKELYAVAEKTGLAIYEALGCSGIARVDMLIDTKTKKVYGNEVNPLPGSLYAHNWNRKGFSNVELVEQLITYARERHDERQALATTFSTNYLQQF